MTTEQASGRSTLPSPSTQRNGRPKAAVARRAVLHLRYQQRQKLAERNCSNAASGLSAPASKEMAEPQPPKRTIPGMLAGQPGQAEPRSAKLSTNYSAPCCRCARVSQQKPDWGSPRKAREKRPTLCSAAQLIRHQEPVQRWDCWQILATTTQSNRCVGSSCAITIRSSSSSPAAR